MADEEKRPEEEVESAEAEKSSTDSHEAAPELDSAASEADVASASSEAEGQPKADEALKAELVTEDHVHHGDDAHHGHDAHPGDDAHHGNDAHGHADHGHGGHDGEHFAHTAPAPMLIGVFVALILLTILTVGVTAVDLGANGNLIIAMVIATVKAVLVMGYFMHMFWDKRFNVLAFTSSFLFLILFLAMALADRGEYQDSIDRWEADKKAIELGK